jgi:hypothetical protein
MIDQGCIRVGQNHIYTVYIQYFWQENHEIYGHIRCIYTVLANPGYASTACTAPLSLLRTNLLLMQTEPSLIANFRVFSSTVSTVTARIAVYFH